MSKQARVGTWQKGQEKDRNQGITYLLPQGHSYRENYNHPSTHPENFKYDLIGNINVSKLKVFFRKIDIHTK